MSAEISYGERDHTIEAKGTITRYHPATGPTMESAGGDPAEGGELEDVKAWIVRETKSRKNPNISTARLKAGYKVTRSAFGRWDIARPIHEIGGPLLAAITAALEQSGSDDDGPDPDEKHDRRMNGDDQ